MFKELAFAAFNPFTWFLLLCITAYFIKRRRLRKTICWTAGILFFIFSNNFLVNEAVLSFERKNPVPPPANYEIGLVLGGFASISLHTGKTSFSGAADRMLQAITLYKKGRIKKIMISGGSADPSQKTKEADLIGKYLLLSGIPANDIILERQSRNTRENILFSFEQLKALKVNGDVLIITSAWHIPRTRKIVERYETTFRTVYFPVNFSSNPKREYTISNLFIPSLGAFGTWQMLIKEYVGLLIS